MLPGPAATLEGLAVAVVVGGSPPAGELEGADIVMEDEERFRKCRGNISL